MSCEAEKAEIYGDGQIKVDDDKGRFSRSNLFTDEPTYDPSYITLPKQIYAERRRNSASITTFYHFEEELGDYRQKLAMPRNEAERTSTMAICGTGLMGFMASEERNTQIFPFMSLTAEVRECIYDVYFPQANHLRQFSSEDSQRANQCRRPRNLQSNIIALTYQPQDPPRSDPHHLRAEDMGSRLRRPPIIL